MLDNPQYRAAWERKRQWYEASGVLPHDQGGGQGGTLICTDDLNGVNVPAWTELARGAIGHVVAVFHVPAKKAAGRPAPPPV